MSSDEKKSRLDKLLDILEESDHKPTLQTAARKVAEVGLQYPENAPAVLRQVHKLLYSKKWETRTYAGEALSHLTRHVRHHSPETLGSGAALSEQEVASLKQQYKFSSLEAFDLPNVLRKGTNILSAGRQHPEELAICFQLQEQRRALKAKLLNVNGETSDSDVDDEEVLVSAGEGAEVTPAAREQGSLSARERNQLKRKFRSQLKPAPSTSSASKANHGAPKSSLTAAACRLTTPQAASTDASELDRMAAGGWPFLRMAEQMLVDLLDSCWQVRHGATIGLRHLLSHHAVCAAVQAPVADDKSGSVVLGIGSPLRLAQVDQTHVAKAVADNSSWLEEAIFLLLCLLVVDRFADYLEDHITAPVRETAAQAIAFGCVTLCTNARTSLLKQLVSLQQSTLWEVRYGGMLAIKYLLAACGSDVGSLVPLVLPALMHCMSHDEDDVRATAAQSCTPICGIIQSQRPDAVAQLAGLLWNMLPTFGELSSAAANVMQLLELLYSNKGANGSADGAAGHASPLAASANSMASLQGWMPRLWPFFRHPLASVQQACASCCRVLSGVLISGAETFGIALDAHLVTRPLLQLAYQSLVIAPFPAMREQCYRLLNWLVQRLPVQALAVALDGNTMAALAVIPSVPIGQTLPMECLCYRPFSETSQAQTHKRKRAACGSEVVDDASASSAQHPLHFVVGQLEGGADTVMQSRVACAQSLAHVAAALAQGGESVVEDARACFQNLLATYLRLHSALGQTFAAMVLMFWMLPLAAPANVVSQDLAGQLFYALSVSATIPYQEVSTLVQQLASVVQKVVASCRAADADFQAPPVSDVITFAEARSILDSVPEALFNNNAVTSAHAHALARLTELQEQEAAYRHRACGALAAACVMWRGLPEKLNTVIKPLMASVRHVQEVELQKEVIAPGLAELVILCIERTPCPNAKILNHLAVLTCGDEAAVPRVPEVEDEESELGALITEPPHVSSASLPAALSQELPHDLSGVHGDHVTGLSAAAIGRRGASAVLCRLAQRTGAHLPTVLPKLWEMVTSPQRAFACAHDIFTAASIEAGSAAAAQEIVNSLYMLQCVAPHMHADLHGRLVQEDLRTMLACVLHVRLSVRQAAVDCLMVLLASHPDTYLERLVESLLPWLQLSASENHRMGGMALLTGLLEVAATLHARFLPFCIYLIGPTLALMSDPSRVVRVKAAACFGTLMAMLPLAMDESRAAAPSSIAAGLSARQRADAAFLQQLLHSSQVEAFEPPVLPRGVQLRGYQREGISWLAFLHRFGLHGVLADDMGLGKTVQTLTMLACAMHAATHDEEGGDGVVACLVVCPATLVGHWVAEATNYFGHVGMQPIAIQGSREQRVTQRQAAKAGAKQVLVTSYEALRSDAAWFNRQRFLYCVLDEGHVIRNPKAKVTQAAMQVVARHRLLLSGTPIQNNVIELWSLFNFLMPGFLGSETAFNAKYLKLHSLRREVKRGPKDQSNRFAALEALHQQVLPFIMRRTKEQVLKDLPPKLMQDIMCELTPLQHALYQELLSTSGVEDEAPVASLLANGDRGALTQHAFSSLSNLRKLCSHPSLAVDWSNPKHLSLLQKHGVAADPQASASAGSSADHETARRQLLTLDHSPKLVALRQLLSDSGILQDAGMASSDDVNGALGPTHRLLVFAQLKGTLDIVETCLLAPCGVSYVRLDGDVPTTARQSIVTRFNSDPTIDVMLLTTSVGGLGLNLTTADTVVFLEHDWNPMKDLQAMDRAHRLGQKRVVTVYRLLMRATLEEDVMSLQRFKLDVASAVVNAENMAMDSMDAGRVLDVVKGSATQAAVGPGARARSLPGSQGQEEHRDGQYDDFRVENFMANLKPPE